MMEPEKVLPSQLAQLLDVEGSVHWPARDSVAALRHQLAAPLLPDLQTIPGAETARLEALVRNRPGAESFFRQLTAIHPSIELLESIKRFARWANECSDHPLRGDGAMILYHAAIAAAIVRCKTRITQLSDQQLREGFAWASNCLQAMNINEPADIPHQRNLATLASLLHEACAMLPPE